MNMKKTIVTIILFMVGDILTLTYNVETCKYYWNGEEYDTLPDAFKQKSGQ